MPKKQTFEMQTQENILFISEELNTRPKKFMDLELVKSYMNERSVFLVKMYDYTEKCLRIC